MHSCGHFCKSLGRVPPKLPKPVGRCKLDFLGHQCLPFSKWPPGWCSFGLASPPSSSWPRPPAQSQNLKGSPPALLAGPKGAHPRGKRGGQEEVSGSEQTSRGRESRDSTGPWCHQGPSSSLSIPSSLVSSFCSHATGRLLLL